MATMPRLRPPYLRSQLTRHGKRVWYMRRGPLCIRLRQPYGSTEFWAEYRNALDGKPTPARPGATRAGTLAWALDQYRKSTAWTAKYSTATRRQREAIFRQVIKAAGGQPLVRITRAKIIEGLDRRSSTPNQARHFLNAMHGFFAWALEAQHVANDPTAGVKAPARRKGGGFKIWTMAELEAYERRWPIGTRERVWMDVVLYSGLRRGDAVRLGRQHRRTITRLINGQKITQAVFQIGTQKGDEQIVVTLPVLPILDRTLAAGPCGDLAFICGERGGPLTKESFGNLFRDACRAAGVKKSAHGLRKVRATRLAESGASEAELEALLGWVRGSRVARIYTASVDRERLALNATDKMLASENDERTSIDTPLGDV